MKPPCCKVRPSAYHLSETFSKFWVQCALFLLLILGQTPSTPQPSKPSSSLQTSVVRPNEAAEKEKPVPVGYVFDDRLSVLRARPSTESRYLRRLRAGHKVWITRSVTNAHGVLFHRVAVSRHVHGWMLAAAVASPDFAGDDEKLFEYAQAHGERISTLDESLLALKLLTDHFPRSKRRLTALTLLGEEADRQAERLTKSAERKLEKSAHPSDVSEKDFYGSFRGLDHFELMGIKFLYDDANDRYLYRGDAHQKILREFSHTPEAAHAEERLKAIRAALKR